MKRLTLIVLCMLAAVTLQAKKHPPFPWDSLHHEVRVGWGDLMFEHAMRYEFTHIGKMNAQIDYITGHFFAEYQYYFRHWLSFGTQLDFEAILWDKTTYDRYRNQVGPTQRERNYNLVLMPELRFTYFRSPYVRMHSGLGIGVNFAFDNMGGFAAAGAFNLDLFTLQVGKDHWYGAIELGMLNAMNRDRLFYVGSRLISVSVGYTL